MSGKAKKVDQEQFAQGAERTDLHLPLFDNLPSGHWLRESGSVELVNHLLRS